MEKMQGHVKWFDAARGYGFLIVEDHEGDVLMHANVLKSFGRSSVSEKSIIEFEAQKTEKGLQVIRIHEIRNPIRGGSGAECANKELKQYSKKELKPARVKWFNKSKGFGFANVFQTTEDVFLHAELLKKYGLSELQVGEAIVIQISDGPKGKMADAIFAWDHSIADEIN